MLRFYKLCLTWVVLILFASCGANVLKFMEGANPDDEIKRIEREKNDDPEKELADAKKELGPKVLKALNAIEKKLDSGTEYKNLTDEDYEDLREAIDTKVIDAIKSGETSDVESDIEKLGRVAQAYARTTSYSELNLLEVLANSAGDSGGANLLEGECPDGMDVFLAVAAEYRGEYCEGTDLVAEIENLEVSALIRTALLTDKVQSTYEFSDDIIDYQNGASSETSELLTDENFSAYLLSLFFQILYVSCEFITDDCEVDSGQVTLGGLKQIWDHFLLASALEEGLRASNLLPQLSFTAEQIIKDISEQAEEISDEDCEYSDKVYCALEEHLSNAGATCSSDSYDEGACGGR